MNTIIQNRDELCDKIFDEPKEATDEVLSRIVYKSTSCGGWCRTDSTGVNIGTIVEGSDAEFERHLSYPFSIEDWDKAWEELEDFADQAHMDGDTW